MEYAVFAPDYAIFTPESVCEGTFTNPGEVLWRRDLVPLVRLCGIPERDMSPASSDYDRFCAVCRAYSMSKGHPLNREIGALWQRVFGELPFDTSDLSALWRSAAEELLKRERKITDFLPKTPWNCKLPSLEIPPLPVTACPMLDGTLFLSSKARTYPEWKNEICQTVDSFVLHGCRQIMLSLQEDTVFSLPSVYHVNGALSAKKRSPETRGLLTVQLFRELCEVCRKRDLSLYAEMDCTPHFAAELLNYTHHSVGLPRLFWSTAEERTADAVLVFQGKTPGADLIRCLRISIHPSDEELKHAISAAAARSPVDRLCFITARDALLLECAEQRILVFFRETRKNL